MEQGPLGGANGRSSQIPAFQRALSGADAEEAGAWGGGECGTTSIAVGQPFERTFQLVLLRFIWHCARRLPRGPWMQVIAPSSKRVPFTRQVQSVAALAGTRKAARAASARPLEGRSLIISSSPVIPWSLRIARNEVFAKTHNCGRGQEPCVSPSYASTSRSIQMGTWSDGFSQPRTWESISQALSRSAACGESSRWSIRIPLFFCQAPA
ncbi:hypothetical protein C8N35_10532 [Breoghania corrubedonensis]|uniref:Uncharacterized protein n=1 Tax=Breoghania corrubedonensis TaxID=665038 RepID=A0A2T5V8F5_9HYPH|nr:hypothetical protein C8N35_10532 [Breoghania corrubedonensis]